MMEITLVEGKLFGWFKICNYGIMQCENLATGLVSNISLSTIIFIRLAVNLLNLRIFGLGLGIVATAGQRTQGLCTRTLATSR